MNESLAKNRVEMNLDLLEWFNKVASNLALIAGAYFAYNRFLKGRAYKVRLAPAISCSFRTEGDTDKLHICAQISNTGLICASIPTQGFPVKILVPERVQHQAIQDVKWKIATAVMMFGNQNSIQVGETLSDEVLLSIPKGYASDVKAHLMVQYGGHSGLFGTICLCDKGSQWDAVSIVSCDFLKDNNPTNEIPNSIGD